MILQTNKLPNSSTVQNESAVKFWNVYNICKLHKHFQHHVQFHVQHGFSKYLTVVQSNCIIFFREVCAISALCKHESVHICKNH